jgi:hypothetical protein
VSDRADIEALGDAIGKVAGEVAAGIILEQQPAGSPWLDVQAKARQLNVSTALLYRHHQDAGGVKIGDVWRFPPEPPTASPQREVSKQQPRKRRGPTTAPLLPIHR